MKVLEEYTDYRKFLRDYYSDLKARTSFFSYRYFSKKAGLKSASLFPEVMDGTRNLTESTIISFCQGLGLDGLKADYFKALVLYTQSSNKQSRQKYLEQMRGLKQKIVPRYLTPDLYDYYAQWYHVVIRELACILEWAEDYKILAENVYPPISEKQARDAVRLLLDLGLLEKHQSGYIQKDTNISSGEEVASLAIRRYNAQMTEWAKIALDHFPPRLRHASNMVVGISPESYQQIKREINYFHQRVTQICHEDKKSNQVYSINVQMFPVAKLNTEVSSNKGE